MRHSWHTVSSKWQLPSGSMAQHLYLAHPLWHCVRIKASPRKLCSMNSAHKVICCHAIRQVGAGGGMKGGVNIWKALKDNHYVHPCWMHCAGRPYRLVACCLVGLGLVFMLLSSSIRMCTPDAKLAHHVLWQDALRRWSGCMWQPALEKSMASSTAAPCAQATDGCSILVPHAVYAYCHAIHYAHRDEDLPRRINEKADEKMKAHMATAEAEAKSDGTKSAIQRAIEIQANAESQELGVAAL